MLEADRNRQRGGSLQEGGMHVKQEISGHANGVAGNSLPAMSMSSSALHHTAPCHRGQVLSHA